MGMQIQVTMDAASPKALAAFWKLALGYRDDDPPEGHDSWDEVLAELPPERRDDANAIIDPDGVGPRLYFQKVPEGKQAKNRVHLDINASKTATDGDGWAAVLAHVERLVAAGGTMVEERSGEWGDRWILMADPDGNEFCVQ